MPRFAANLSLLFTELGFLERFDAAARAGFAAVEVQFPYEQPAPRIAERLQRAGLQLVVHNLPAGDWNAGERGIAGLPGREEEFRAGVARAIATAQALGCDRLNCLAGIRPQHAGERAVQDTLVSNLRHAADALGAQGMELLVEALNTHDVPGYLVNTSRQAFDLIDAVARDNLRLQYDVYHMQRMEGDLAVTLAARLPGIGHIQVADNPGRHEPGTGEIRFPYLFERLDALGYAGWVGCEYRPRTTTLAGLGWLRPWMDVNAPTEEFLREDRAG